MADGHGTTITFGTSGYSASLVSIDDFNVTRNTVENTHMGSTTAKAYLAGALYEWELTATVVHAGNGGPPIDSAAETVTIDWGGDGNTWAGSGHCTAYSAKAAMGERMEASITVKGSGAITGL